jgi:hypothetical protein
VGSYIDEFLGFGQGRPAVSYTQQVQEIIKGGKDFIEHGDLKRLRKVAINLGTSFFGMGGGGQINNVIDGIQADIEEEVKNVEGKKLFEVKDFKSKIKAPIWGIWSTKGGIEYWNKRENKTRNSIRNSTRRTQ